MKSAVNILTLFVTLLLLVACQTTIPNVRIYKEIPFIDAPEAVYVESLTRADGSVLADEWARMKPVMLMIRPEDWKAIKDSWYEVCRKAGSKCNVPLDSIKSLGVLQ